MMQKAATDNVVCIACGADVRTEALFCYNCGGAVAVHPEADDSQVPTVDEAELTPNVTSSEPEEAVTAAESVAPMTNGTKAEPKSKPLTATMLRKKRAYNRRPVEVVWEEPSGHSVTFVVTSIVFTILAVLLLAAALYLK